MADARLQVTIDAVDNASKQIKGVAENLNRFGAQARQVGLAMSLLGGAALAGMTLAIKSTADGQKAMEALGATTGKLRDTIGQALVPVIVQLNAVLQPVVERVIAFIREHPRLVQWLMLAAVAVAALGTTLFILGTAIRAGVAAFGLLHAILPVIIGLINTLLGVVNALTGSMLALQAASVGAWLRMLGPILAVAAALLLAQHAFIAWARSWDLISQDSKSLLEKLPGFVSELVDDMVGALIPATAKFGAEFKGATADAADGVQALIDKIRKLREVEEKVAEAAADVGAHWVSLGAQTEDFLERVFGPQVEAAQSKLIALGLDWQQAWNVAQMQVARAVETVMEKAAAASNQGAAVMEAFRRGAISMAEAWGALGAEIEDVGELLDDATAKVIHFNMVAFATEAAAETSAIMRGVETIFGSLAETFAQRMPGGTEQLQAFRAGARSPELEEFIRLLAQITRIYLGQDPTYRAAPGQNWLNIQIDGRTIASILGGQAAIGEQVRSS